MISLGCAKNLVDAEIMIGSLLKDGMEITNDAASADVLVVNTCSFIEAAQQESIDTILESAELREAHHRGQGLVVSGCLPQRFRDELPKLLPEVDAFMGVDQVSQVSEIVRQAQARRATRQRLPATRAIPKKIVAELARTTPQVGAAVPLAEARVNVSTRPRYIPDYATPRFRLTPRHFAYVKIAEGCNHPCSFCIIPRMRGSHRSRAQEDIVAEGRQLLLEGVRELNLISQDSTYYGLDLRPARHGSIASPDKFRAATESLPAKHPTLSSLIRELNALPGEFWIRLLYTHPAHWTDELMAAIADCPKVARYIDIPLQHIHPNLLERMRRETTREYIVDLIARLRAALPGVTLRTTFIVGFPGETEACFETLLDFLRETRFERLGVFTYSHEEGTLAGQMRDQIPETVKQERKERAMAVQQEISREIARSFVGRKLRVLVEKELDAREAPSVEARSWEHGLTRRETAAPPAPGGKVLVARAEGDAPDIDGRVYVRGSLPLGSFARVKVTGHTDYDLIATAI
jgi:ribosomal protein S12 methylthiotransferase